MEDVYLLFGSNLGDRKSNIERALTAVGDALGNGAVSVSPIVQTGAVGFDGPDFLNCVALFRCIIAPEELLRICKDIERRMGRRDTPEYAADGTRIYHDRIIDIDIILFGDRKISTSSLVIPHPQLESREFVAPLLENCKRNLKNA